MRSSLRIEDDVKKKAEQACADIGMSLSAAWCALHKNLAISLKDVPLFHSFSM